MIPPAFFWIFIRRSCRLNCPAGKLHQIIAPVFNCFYGVIMRNQRFFKKYPTGLFIIAALKD
jgi:hypothetical protein